VATPLSGWHRRSHCLSTRRLRTTQACRLRLINYYCSHVCAYSLSVSCMSGAPSESRRLSPTMQAILGMQNTVALCEQYMHYNANFYLPLQARGTFALPWWLVCAVIVLLDAVNSRCIEERGCPYLIHLSPPLQNARRCECLFC
jgi:hypothetical protein